MNAFDVISVNHVRLYIKQELFSVLKVCNPSNLYLKHVKLSKASKCFVFQQHPLVIIQRNNIKYILGYLYIMDHFHISRVQWWTENTANIIFFIKSMTVPSWLYKRGKKYWEIDYISQKRERCQICHHSLSRCIRNTHAAVFNSKSIVL